MAMTDWTIIKSSMRARWVSTVVTVLLVAVSVALLLVLLSMRHAGERAFSRGSGNAHLIVSRDNAPLLTVLNQLFYKELPPRSLAWKEYQTLASNAPYEWAIPTQLGDSYKGQPVLATLPEFFTEFQPIDGQPWKLDERRSGGRGAPAGGARFLKETFDLVLGAQAARATGLSIGDHVHLTHGAANSRDGGGGGHAGHVHDEFSFTVVGILEPTGSAHDRAIFAHLNAAWLMHALDKREAAEGHSHDEHDHDHDHAHDHDHEPPIKLLDLTDADRLVTGVLLRVATRPGMNTSAAIQSVFDQLRRDPTISVAQPVQQITFLFRIVSSVDQILLAMAAAVMVSAGISVFLSLYNSMSERRRQIAILRVLGSSASRIFGLVLTESALIGLMGAAAGAVLSVGASYLVSEVMFTRLGLLIEPTFGAEWVLAVMVGAVMVSAVAGIAPALAAYRTSVADNLKPIA